MKHLEPKRSISLKSGRSIMSNTKSNTNVKITVVGQSDDTQQGVTSPKPSATTDDEFGSQVRRQNSLYCVIRGNIPHIINYRPNVSITHINYRPKFSIPHIRNCRPMSLSHILETVDQISLSHILETVDQISLSHI